MGERISNEKIEFGLRKENRIRKGKIKGKFRKRISESEKNTG